MKRESKYRGIAFSGFVVAIITIISKFVALAKQSVMAYYFGATVKTDALFFAESFVSCVANILFASVAVVLLSSYVYEKDDKDGLFTNCYVFCFVIDIVLCILLVIFAPAIANILGSGYSISGKIEFVRYIRIMSISLVPITLWQMDAAVLQAEKHFAITKTQSIINSIFIIGFVLVGYKRYGVLAALLGLIFAEFGYFFILRLNARKYVTFRDGRFWKDNRILELIKKTLPLMLGSMVVYFSTIFDKALASTIGEGTATHLYYGQIASHDIISAVVVSALGTVFYSYFTEYVKEQEFIKLSNLIKKLLTLALLFLLPGTVYYLFFSQDIVKVLFGHGSFGIRDVNDTALIAVSYAIGFFPMAAREFLVKAHYAIQDTKSPMINAMIGTVVNVGVSIYLSRRIGSCGIAIGTTVSYFVIAGLAVITLKRNNIRIGLKEETATLLKIILANLLLCIVVFGMKNLSPEESIWGDMLIGVVSFVGYLLLISVLRIDELKFFQERILNKLKRRSGNE